MGMTKKRLSVSLVIVCQWVLFMALSPTGALAQEDNIVIGVNVPLTGSYDLQGKDERMAYELAVDKINAQGGLLGKKVAYIVKDTQTKADVARQNAIDLIRNNRVAMITGGSSSAVALAQADVAQENGVVFMAALTHSNATTGFGQNSAGWDVQKAHRHTFRWYFNAWMTGEAIGPQMIEEFGKEAEYYYITADYTWGHSLERSLKYFTERRAAW